MLPCARKTYRMSSSQKRQRQSRKGQEIEWDHQQEADQPNGPICLDGSFIGKTLRFFQIEGGHHVVMKKRQGWKRDKQQMENGNRKRKITPSKSTIVVGGGLVHSCTGGSGRGLDTLATPSYLFFNVVVDDGGFVMRLDGRIVHPYDHNSIFLVHSS